MSVISESLERAVGVPALPKRAEEAFVDYLDKSLGFAYLRGKPDSLDVDAESVGRAQRRFRRAMSGVEGLWSFGGHNWKWGNFGVERVS